MSAESLRPFRLVLLSSAITAINAAWLIAVYLRSAAHVIPFASFLACASLFCFIEALLVNPAVVLGRENGDGRIAALTGLSIAAIFLTAIATGGSASMVTTSSGAMLMMLGVLLRAIAIRTLGPRFTTELRADGPLVEHGIYGWLAHPSELGLLSVTLGAAIIFRSEPAFAIWLLCTVPLTISRIRAENAFLRLQRRSDA